MSSVELIDAVERIMEACVEAGLETRLWRNSETKAEFILIRTVSPFILSNGGKTVEVFPPPGGPLEELVQRCSRQTFKVDSIEGKGFIGLQIPDDLGPFCDLLNIDRACLNVNSRLSECHRYCDL